MKQITDEELRAIRERAEKATAGEWQIADTTDGVWLIDEDDLIIAGTFERIEDAVFSKHARQDIPKLLAEIDRLSRLYCELKEIAHNIEVDRNETAAEYREYYEKSEAEIERLRKSLESVKSEIEYSLYSKKTADVKRYYLENAIRIIDIEMEELPND